MDLPTPLKTLPFALPLGVRALALPLALALALAFALTFAFGWRLLNFVPAVILLLPLLQLLLLRCQLLASTPVPMLLTTRLMHNHRRQRADQVHSKQGSVRTGARCMKTVFVLLCEVCHELTRAGVGRQLVAFVLRARPHI